MEKILYVSGIALLFLGIVVAMWFLPFGRNLDADNQYLREAPHFKGK